MRNWIDYCFCLMMMVVLSACASQKENRIDVRNFHLSDINLIGEGARMARGEQLYRMRGAVTRKEKQSKLGYYYTVNWRRAKVSKGGLKLVMKYQQAGTAFQVLTMVRHLPDDQYKGTEEFHIIGESYRTKGEVLAWRVQLCRGSDVLSEKKSYLWR